MLDLRRYITVQLRADDYTALVSDNCGCLISDMAPCSASPLNCYPGYAHFCKDCPSRPAEESICPRADTSYQGYCCTSLLKDWPTAEECDESRLR